METRLCGGAIGLAAGAAVVAAGAALNLDEHTVRVVKRIILVVVLAARVVVVVRRGVVVAGSSGLEIARDEERDCECKSRGAGTRGTTEMVNPVLKQQHAVSLVSAMPTEQQHPRQLWQTSTGRLDAVVN